MTQVTRAPVQCADCPTVFTPLRPGPFKRCPTCSRAAQYRSAREWRARNPLPPAATSKPCRTCGAPVPRSGKVYAWYCSDACKPRCSVDECGQPERKLKLCASHYSQQKRKGVATPFSYKWNPAGLCPACGEPTGVVSGMRRFCSAPCRAYWTTYGGKLPGPVACAHCRKDIPVGKVDGRVRRRRSDVRMCQRCKAGLRKHGMSVEQLATRDGANCSLCGAPVDMTKHAPHPGCPSVDHRIPRARGGTNDPANLQLAHLVCNVLKRDSLPT
jgi:hypothetical protein